jgi:hypothetical protein
MIKTLKKEIGKVRKDDKGWSTGELIGRISTGEKVEVTFENGMMIVEGTNCATVGCTSSYGDRLTIKASPRKYAMYFGGSVPSVKTLERWELEGYCKTVTGQKTEPDGYGLDGSPSWLLALGMI